MYSPTLPLVGGSRLYTCDILSADHFTRLLALLALQVAR